ncbi:hypothetical protein GGR27_001882 [Lewinella antarctica]|uniref:Uncharacterized protein n=1 Tax=Neolewinella antarctica TaxID=442734 RepID=A0ABX0XBS5_9BACT|nr:hypothetical protein [Neolewinella antarctica]
MPKEKQVTPKAECCQKYLKKKDKYCKRCPLILTPDAPVKFKKKKQK